MNVQTQHIFVLGKIASLLKAKNRTDAIQSILIESRHILRADTAKGLDCFRTLRKHIKDAERTLIDRYALKRAGLVFLDGRYVASTSFDFNVEDFRWNGPAPEAIAQAKAEKAQKAANKAAREATDAAERKARKDGMTNVEKLAERLQTAIKAQEAIKAATLSKYPGALLGYQSKESNKTRANRDLATYRAVRERQIVAAAKDISEARAIVESMTDSTLLDFAVWFETYQHSRLYVESSALDVAA